MSIIRDCYYLGGRYEYETSLSGWQERLYLNGDYYTATAVYTKEQIHVLKGDSDKGGIVGPGLPIAKTLRYIVRDHLGSITHVVSSTGSVIQVLSYDAWGRLRNSQTNAVYAPGSEPTLVLGRGYCGHEHIQQFGLINMNARLYDPILGRFLSPDPYVQMPDCSQNYNRYSYCMNSPLMYVDKDGKSFLGLLVAVVAGAIIGSTTSAATYAITSLITGNWDASAFWRSVGIGAFAGALGGGFGYAGSALGIASTGNSLGYNFISQTTNTIVTNSLFGNDIGLGDMLGIAAGATAGTFLPTYKATQGGWFRNTVGETLHNTARGMATGAAQGLVDWALKGNSRYFFQDIFGGGISGFSRTVVMNLILGAPYSSTFSKFSQGRYRTGGLSSFLFSKRGVALGNNLFVAKGKHDLWTMVHENYHISQQMQPDTGWAGFYGQWLIELLSNIGRNIYKIDGTLENAAEYSTYKLFMGITNAIEERNKIAL